MARQKVKNLYVREVESGRKTCPHCKSLKRDMKDPRVFAMGEYITAKWHNLVDRFCEFCFDERIETNLIRPSVQLGVKINFIGKDCQLPWFLTQPMIFADNLEDRGHEKASDLYRKLAERLEN